MHRHTFFKNGGVLAVLIITGVLSTSTVMAAPVITEYNITSPGATATDIVEGSNGNLWFTEQATNKIGEISPSGAVTEFTVPTASSGPTGITSGPDGNIWFTEENAGKVGVFNIATSTFHEYSLGATFPVGITSGPNNDLWIVEQDGLAVAQMNTSGTVLNSFETTYGGNYITEGPDGNLWITANAHIIKMTPTDIQTVYSIPGASPAAIGNIVVGSNNNLWFADSTDNSIDQVTTSGVFTRYAVTTASSSPEFVAKGPDGNIWFTENTGNNIGSVTTAGTFNTYNIPTAASAPLGITTGPNNTLWFVESAVAANKVGEINNILIPTTPSASTTAATATTAGTPDTGYGAPRHLSVAVLALIVSGIIAILSAGGLAIKRSFSKH